MQRWADRRQGQQRDDVSSPIGALQSAKDAPSALADWSGKKAETEQLMKLMQTYRSLGDAGHEVGSMPSA